MRSGDITRVAGVTGVDLVLHCNISLLGGLVVTSEFWFDVMEFVYVVFGVHGSSGGERHYEESVSSTFNVIEIGKGDNQVNLFSYRHSSNVV